MPPGRLIAAAAVLPTLTGSAQPGTNIWTSNGPYGGSVTALTIDPATPSTLYAETGSGVFKSTDGGASWSVASNGAPSFVEALAIDPTGARVAEFDGPAGTLFVKLGKATLGNPLPALSAVARQGELKAAAQMAKKLVKGLGKLAAAAPGSDPMGTKHDALVAAVEATFSKQYLAAVAAALKKGGTARCSRPWRPRRARTSSPGPRRPSSPTRRSSMMRWPRRP